MQYFWIIILANYQNNKKSKFSFITINYVDNSNYFIKWLNLQEVETLFNAEVIIKNWKKN